MTLYEFVDLNESKPIHKVSLATNFNSVNLDNALSDSHGSFTTLSVTGRGLSNRVMHTYDKQGDGVGEHSTFMDVREIVVKYRLKDEYNEGFRQRYNELNRLLSAQKALLEFDDEQAYFLATCVGGDEPEENTNDIIGTITFVCTDPNKYAYDKTINVTSTPTEHVVEGHKSTTWRTVTTIAVKTSHFELQFNEVGKTALRDINKLRLNYSFVSGDVLEIDYRKRRATVNGNDITNSISMLQSNFKELPISKVEVKASQNTKLIYNERFY